MRSSRLTARHALLLVFAAATLALTVAGALASITLLRTSLYQAAKQEAGREARAVADMGLAAALSHGRLTARDLQVAASQYAAARRDVPLTGVVIWLPPGRPIFARGTGRGLPIESRLVTGAGAIGATRVASDPKLGATLDAAVPLGTRALGAVVEFHFAGAGIERDLSQARRRLYTLAGIAALVMYLAILPLLAWLAKRVPLPVDPFHRAALAEFRAAIAHHELVVHYQPKVEIESGRVVGVEALVRWHHPRRGLLSPAEFLPLAESTPELLAALTRQVVDCAIRDCAEWLDDGHELPVAINVAPAVLLHSPLATLVRQSLERYQLDARRVTLEMTEGALMESQAEVSEHLRELRALGVSVSIDDFGTGNSSLSRLRSLPLDELKVDRSFIVGIASDERDLGITRHIVHLALELGLKVVAEGVEDEQTLRLLSSLGCEVAQGFHLARPMPAEQLILWVRAQGPAASAGAMC